MKNIITFEHPLNERIRTLLRLEFLFKQTQHHLNGKSSWDSRMVITSLLDILDFLSRSDLKTELIKELERTAGNLERHAENPSVDQHQLGAILERLNQLRSELHAITGQLGQELRGNEFLNAIRQRSSIPGGSCEFDLPLYHLWLHQAAEHRLQEQRQWFATLDPIHHVVELILKMIRNSARPSRETAVEGVYQHSLDPNEAYQLIRVGIASELGCFAEISGGRHRFSLRFMRPNPPERAKQVTEDIPFRLTCCIL